LKPFIRFPLDERAFPFKLLRVSSKIIRIATGSLPKKKVPFAAEGMIEHDQAPGQCPQRRRMSAFEPAPAFGTTPVTDLNLYLFN
jgi:hypothetical protein